MTMRFPRLHLPAALASAGALWLASSQPALAVEETDLVASTHAADVLPGAAAVAEATPGGMIVGNGSPVKLEQLGIAITPPVGWEVETNTGSLTMIMREPKVTAPDYEKPKYQRNITVATIQHPSPIDEKRATELEGELAQKFTADGSVGNFKVIEHKFFNYRGANDGLIVYSSMTIGEYPMMQMHVLVSGQDRQFLLTYTDLADRFSDAKDGNFEKAWNSIVSIEVTGPSPERRNDIARYGAMVGGLALLGLLGFLLSRRAKRVDYASEADGYLDEGGGSLDGSLSGSMLATLAGTWKLNGDGAAGMDGMEFTQDAAPVTRQTEYVSSY